MYAQEILNEVIPCIWGKAGLSLTPGFLKVPVHMIPTTAVPSRHQDKVCQLPVSPTVSSGWRDVGRFVSLIQKGAWLSPGQTCAVGP